VVTLVPGRSPDAIGTVQGLVIVVIIVVVGVLGGAPENTNAVPGDRAGIREVIVVM
jgi:hypothetical protein